MEPEDNSLSQDPDKALYASSLESQNVSAGSQKPNEVRGRSLVLRYNRLAFVATSIAIILIIVIGAASYVLTNLSPSKQKTENSSQPVANYGISSLPLQGVKVGNQLQLGEADHLAINGQLQVNNTLVISPTNIPSSPVTGQIYYSQSTNQPYYYNGSQFISLEPTAAPQHVTSLGGVAGVLGLGNGLQITGNLLTISSTLLQSITSAGLNSAGVTSLQGLTGKVVLTAGSGIDISGTSIANSGVLNLNGTPDQVNVSAATGNVTLSLPQSIDPTSNVQFNNLILSGNLSLSPTATVDADNISTINNGDNLAVNSSNNITFSNSNGANSFTFPTSGGAGQVICTTAITCASGGGQAVLLEPSAAQTTSANKDSIFVNKIAGTGNLIELEDGGVDALVVDNAGNTTISNLAVTNSASVGVGLTVGTPSTTSGNLYLANSGSSRLVDIQGLAPSGAGNATIQIPSVAGGSTDTVCLESLANCVGTGGSVSTSGGTQDYITKYTNAGATQLGNSELYDNGSGVAIGSTSPAGLFNVGATNQFQVSSTGAVTAVGVNSGTGLIQGTGGLTVSGGSGASISNGLNNNSGGITNAGAISGATSITGSGNINTTAGALELNGVSINTAGTLSNVAYLNQADTFSAAGTALAVTNSASVGVGLTVGTPSTTSGNLYLANSGSSRLVDIQGLAPSGAGNATIQIPSVAGGSTDTVCLESLANCVGTGGSVSTSGGTQDYITKYTNAGATQLGNSELYDNGSGVAIGSTSPAGLFNVGATNQFQVSSTGAVTAVGVNSGTGLIQGTGGLTVSGGSGASISNGLNNNSGGITNAGAISGATSITGSGNINTTAGALELNGVSINTAGTLSNVAYLNQADTFSAAGTALAVTNSASVGVGLTVGTPSTTSGNLYLANSGSSRLVDIQGLAPSGAGNATIQIPSVAGGSTDTVCLESLANCVGTGGSVSTSGGTQDYITKYTNAGATQLGNSELYDNGSGVAIGSTSPAGLFNVGATNQFQVSSTGAVTAVGVNSGTGLIQGTGGLTVSGGSGASISNGLNNNSGGITNAGAISGATSITGSGNINTTAGALELNGVSINTAGTLSNVAYLNQADTFSAAGTALAVTNSASVGVGLTVGTPSTTSGNLYLANSGSSRLVDIQGLAPSGAGNATIQIPSVAGGSTDTVCLESLANCVGTGGSVSTSGGTQDYITKYTNAGATQLGNSELYDNGSGVAIGSTSPAGLFNVGATNQFQVSSTGAVTAVGVNSGTGLIQGTGGLTVSGGSGASISNGLNNNSGGITNAGAISGATSITASGLITDSSNTTGLTLSGTPTAGTGITALLQLGNALSGGNSTANGGTYLSINEPSSGAGSAADFLNFENNNTSEFELASNGSLTVAGLTTLNGGASISNGLNNNSGGITNAGAISGATSITGSGNINTTAGALELNGVSINTAGTLSNVAYLNQADTFSAAGTALAVTNSASVGVGLTVGTPSTTSGNLYLANSGSSRLVDIQGLAPSGAGNATIQIPSVAGGSTDTVCLESLANCVGTGGSVSTSGGTQDYITKYTNAGATQLGNSELYDNGSGVAIGSTSPAGLFNVGATNQFQVSSTGAVTAVGVNSGTGLIQGTGGLTVSGGSGASISNGLNNNSGGITNAGAISGATSITASGLITDSSNTTGLTLSGTPTAGTGITALLQLGNALSGGNSTANGGTYLSINEPSSGAGSAADFLNFENNNTSEFELASNGSLTVAGLTTLNGGASISNGLNNNSGGITNAGAISGATSITGSGNINTTAGALELNGVSINTAGTLSNVAYLNQADTFSAAGTALAVTNSASVGVGLTVGTPSTTSGNLYLANSGSSRLVDIQGLAPSGAGNATIQIPSVAGGSTDTVCLESLANCSGSGGGLSGSGATGDIAVFSGSTSLSSSLLSESGTTVTAASSAVFENPSNSTAAFQVQNSNGYNELNVDTSGNVVTLGNVTATAGHGISGVLAFADGGTDNDSAVLELSGSLGGGATVFQLPVGSNTTQTICTSAGNCVGTGGSVSTSGGTQDYITKYTNAGATQLGNSELYDNGSGVAIGSTSPAGLFNVGATNQFQVSSTGAVTAVGVNSGTGLIQGTGGLTVSGGSGASISNGLNNNSGGITNAGAISGATSITGSGNINTTAGALELNGVSINTAGTLSNVAYLNQADTFSAAGTALAVTNSASVGVGLTVGTPSTTSGNLYLANSGSSRLVDIQGLAPSGAGNATIQIPSVAGGSTDTVCLESLANCVGTGGSVSTSGGTQDYITKYTNAGATQLGNSELYDNGSGVAIGSTSPAGLFNVGATNQFQVSSTGAVTAVGVNSGTGLIQGTGGLTVSGGSGASISNGLNNNSGGITNAGAISGATSITGSGNINTTAGALELNGVSINTAGTLSNVAYLNQADTFSAAGTALAVTNSASVGVGLTVGTPSTTSGNLYLANSGSSRLVDIQGLAPSGAGNATIQIPSVAGGSTDTVCLESLANCVGTGGSVSTSGGTQDYITKYTNAGATQLGNSELYDNGSGVAIGSTSPAGLFNVGATNQFQVSSTGAVTAVGVNSGTGLIQGTGGLTVSGGSGASISNGLNNNSGGITNAGAISGATSITASGLITDSSNTTGLTLSGTPTAGTGITALLQLGNALSGGNSTANGGTYLSINEPSSGAGSAADFLNFENNNTSEFELASNGSLTVAGLTTLNGGASISNGLNNNSGGITNAGAISGATSITGSGNINTTAGALELNGVSINTAGTLSNVAYLNQADTFSAAGTALAVTNSASVGVGLTVGTPSTTSGNLYLANSGSSRLVDIQGLAPSGAGNATIQIPSVAGGSTDTVCLESLANCVGTGGSVSTSGGTQDYITKYTNAGATQLGNSELYDNGSGVAIGSTSPAGLFNVGATNQFQVSSTGAVTAVGVNSGTGLIQGTGGLTVSGGSGASISNGLNNNSGGITNAGAISGATSITGSGNINTTAGALELNGVSINTAGTLSNVAYLNQADTFSAAGTALAVTNSASVGVGLTVGTPSTTSGNLYLANSGSSRLVDIQGLAPSGAGNATIQIPSVAGGSTDTVCLESLANCVGTGGSVSTSGGTQDYITKYTNAGATQLGNSELYDNGSGVAIGSTSPAGLFNVGATNQFQVSSTGAVTAVGVNSGTGLIQGTGGLTVSGGSGASISNGLNNNSGGITNAGAISGATSITGSGNINTTAGALELNGVSINTAGTLSNVAYLNQADTFSAAGTALAVTNSASVGVGLTVGTPSTTSGNLYLANSGSSRLVDIQGLAPSGAGNATIQIPSVAGGSTDTVCLESLANCVGTGGSVSTSGGTQDYITKYTNAGATQLGNSELYDNGSGVAIGSTSPAGLFNVGATNQFQVSSTGAVTAVGVNSGTGLIQGTGGLTVSGGSGASISNGLNNNSGGITNAGAISGATSITGSGNINTTAGALELNGVSINTAGTLSNVAYLNQADTFSAAGTALAVTNSASVGVGLTVGTPSTTSGNLYLANSGSSRLVDIQGLAPSGAGNATIQIPSVAGGSTDTVCLESLANCVGTGGSVSTSGGTQDYITKYTNAGATQLGNSELYDNGSGVAIGSTSPAGLFNVGATNQFQVSSTGAVTAVGVNSGTGLIQGTGGLTVSGGSGASISNGLNNNSGGITNAGAISGATSITGSGNINTTAGALELNGVSINTAGTLSNVAYLNQADTFSAAGTALAVTNSASVGVGLTVGTPSTTSGNLYLANSGSSRLVDIQGLAPSGAGNATIQIPSVAGGSTDTVCLESLANCVGTGGSVSTSGGTQDYITKYTNAGATQLGNSELYDNGSGVAIGSTSPAGLFNVGATNQFQVSSTGAVTAVGVNSGTGLIQGTGGLTVSGGSGASISNGLNNNSGGITNAGAISGATSITGSGNINTTAGALELNGVSINTAGTLSNVAYLNQADTFSAAGTALAVTNSASVGVGLTVGTPSTTSGNLYLANSGSSRLVDIQGLAPSGAGNATIQIPSVAGGSTDTVCLESLANCVGTGGSVSTSGGTQDYITKYTNAGATQLGNSELYDNGSGVAIGSTSPAGLFNVGATNQFQVSSTGAVTAVGVNSGTGLIQGTGGLTVSGGSGASISNGLNNNSGGITNAGAISGATSITGSGNINTTAGALELNGVSINTAGTLSNVAYLNQADTFSAAGTALAVTNSASVGVGLTVGTPSTTSGNLYLANSGSSRLVDIQGLAPSGAGNATIQIPSVAGGSTDTVCLESLANCVGTGGSVSTSGGTQDYITKYTNAGATQLGNSELYDNGSGVAIGSTSPAGLFNVGATNQFQVSSTGAVTAVGVNSGTGLIQGTGGLTVSGGSGASISNGLNNNSGGITNAGAISGATSITGSGNINTTAGALELNGVSINTAGTLSNVAYLNQADTFSAAGTALAVTNSASVGVGLTVGTPSTTSGNLYLANSGSSRLVDIQGLAPSGAGNATIQIPSVAGGSTDTVCLESLNNCGTGGGGTGYIQNLKPSTGTAQSANLYIKSADTTGNVTAAIEAIGSQTGDLLDFQNASGGLLSGFTAGGALSFASANTVSTTTGTLTLQGFGGTTITTPNVSGAATSAISITSGNVTSGSFVAGNVSIDTGTSTGTAGAVNIGNANASAVNIGNTTSTTNVTLQGGATSISLQNSGTTLTNNSTTALTVTSGATNRAPLLNLDTSGDSADLITNADFETNFSGWSGDGSGSVATSTVAHLYGAQSLAITTTTAAGDGAKYPIALSPSTTYTLDIPIYSTSTISLNGLAIGYSDTGTVGGESDFTTNTTTINANTWVHTYLTFTTGATVSPSSYVYIKQNNSGTARTFYTDGDDLEQTSGGSPQYRTGTVQLTGAITSPLIVQTPVNNNNTAAFTVLNSTGQDVLAVDTVNNQVLVGTTAGNGKFTVVSGTGGQIAGRFVTNGTNVNDTEQVESDNTTGTQSNGIYFNRNATGGTTTNGLQIANTLGTLTNGITLTGTTTIGTGINTSGTLTTGINLGGTLTTGINLSGTYSGNLISNTNFTVSNAGVVTLQGNQTADITTAAQGTLNTNGNNLSLSSSAGNGTGSGGALNLQSAASGSGATGNGGGINITAGNAASTNGNGGSITLQAGSKTGSGTNGGVFIPYVTGGSSTAFQVQGSGNPLLTLDTANTHVIIGSTGSCAGLATGRFCVNQATTASASGNLVNQNNSLSIATSAGVVDAYENYINLSDTNTGVSDIDDLLYMDASSSTNTSATVNGIISKVTSGQAGNFLQFINGATTALQVSNAGVVILQGAQAQDITTAGSATAVNALTFQPGLLSAATGTGANFTLQAGNESGTTTATGGTLNLEGGNATGGSGSRTGGNVSIDAGTGATANGIVSLGDVNAATINIGSSSAQATTINIGKNGETQLNLKAGGGTTNISEDGAASNVVNIATSNFSANSKTDTINIGTVASTGNTGDIVNTTIGPAAALTGGTVTGATILQAQGLSDTITASTTNPTDIIQTVDNSTGALEVENASSNIILNVDTSGNIVTLGNVTAAAGHGINGELAFADGSNDNDSAILELSGSLGGSATVFQLPVGSNTTQTICTSVGNCLGGGSGGANTALSNLATTSINANLIPNANNTLAVGNSSNNWSNIYGTTLDSSTLTFNTASAGTIDFQGAAISVSNALNITGQMAGGSNNNGGAVTLQGGTSTGTGTGGLATIEGGAASTTSGSAGGGVTIEGSNGTATSTGGAGGAVLIQAGNATSTGNNNGGNITLQAGSATGTGTVGGVLVKNAGNSTTAFQIQSSSSAALLTGDTTDMRLGVDVTYTIMSSPGTLTGTAKTENATPTVALTGGTGTGISYSYKVVAVTANGDSGASNSGTVGNSVAFTSLNATTYNHISWTGYGGAIGYLIYRASGTGASLGLIGSTGGATTFNDTGLSANGTVPTSGGSVSAGTYYYEITALDSAGGETAPTDQISVTTTGTTKTVDLSWPAVTGAIGYRIYRTTVGGASGSETLYDYTTTTVYTDTGIGPDPATNPPSSTNAYVSSNVSNNNLQLTVGGNGTPTGQLYVGGTIPSTATGAITTTPGLGDVYVSGHYAYVTSTNYMEIFDVSNPDNPVLVGSIADGGVSVFVQGHYAYLENVGQLVVINVSDPAAPVNVGSVNLSSADNDETSDGLYVSGNYAYVAEWSGDFNIINVSNPASPVIVGTFNQGGDPNSVFVSGRYAYVGEWGDSVSVYDISNPASASVVATYNAGGTTNINAIYVQGGYLYLTDANNGGQIYILNVSSPTTCSSNCVIGSISTGGNPTVIYVQGRYAYVTNESNNTLGTFDISNPYVSCSSSCGVGTVSTGSGSNPIGLFVSGRYAYVANNGTSALAVYDLGGEYAQQLQAGGAEVGTLQVDNNAAVYGDQSIQGGLSVGANTDLNGSLSVGSTTLLQGTLALAGGIQGGATLNGLSTPSAPVVTSTSGGGTTTTWSYEVVAVGASGATSTTPASAAGSISSADYSTLNGTNYNIITWVPVTGAVSYQIYRTATTGAVSPTTTGLIATTSANFLDDTGLAGNSATAPTLDTSGQLTVNAVATFEDDTNSATAFQVQNANGNAVLTESTTTGTLTATDGSINLAQVANPTSAPGLGLGGAGAINGVDYYYTVVYVTSSGTNTGYSRAEIAGPISPTNQEVNLTAIPISPSPYVTGREICRTDVSLNGNAPTGPFYLVTTLANNTATTYTDDSTDATIFANGACDDINNTGLLETSGSESVITDSATGNTGVGFDTLEGNISGLYNVGVGADALADNTFGSENTALGVNALDGNTTGVANIGIGQNAGAYLQTQNGNTIIGYNAEGVTGLTGGSNNTVEGANDLSLAGITSAATSVVLGEGDFYNTGSVTSLSNDIVIGSGIGAGLTGALNNYLNIGGLLTGSVGANSADGFEVQNTAAAPALIVSTNNVTAGYNAANATLMVAKDSGTGRSINAAGTINASGADYAEYFTQSVSGQLQPGQLVCLTPAGLAEPCNSSDSQDQMVGVVSTNPGYVGNDIYNPADPGNTALVGLLGQIPVQVSTANGPIEAGDMLTISPTTGVAELATGPGIVIGSALENYTADGVGSINVYVHVGYYVPAAVSYVQNGANASLAGLTVSGDTELSNLNVSGPTTLTDLTVQSVTITGGLSVEGLTSVQDIQVNGHIITSGNAPTVSALSAAGSSNASTQVTGNDTSGTITITTGDPTSGNATGPTVGDLVALTFNKLYGSAPRVILSANNAVSADLGVYSSSIGTSSFNVSIASQPSANTTYSFTYFVVQ